jgi:hypothetical protein
VLDILDKRDIKSFVRWWRIPDAQQKVSGSCAFCFLNFHQMPGFDRGGWRFFACIKEKVVAMFPLSENTQSPLGSVCK